MGKVAPKSAIKPAHPSGKPTVSYEAAQAHATKLYERSADLEVLVRHQVYPKTIKQIDQAQYRLNRLRTHVEGSLKKKELRKLKWQGIEEDNFNKGFLLGVLVGAAIMYVLCRS